MLIRGISLRQVRWTSQIALERFTQIPQRDLIWKTEENNPLKHDASHLGLYYILPGEQECSSIFGHPSPFRKEITYFYKTIDVMPIMVRKPSLTAIDFLKKATEEVEAKPNQKMLLYGDRGHGKTHSLTHIVHYHQCSGKRFIFHARDIKRFTIALKENPSSTTRLGRIDTPLHAALLLQQIKTQNEKLLEELRDTLTCSQDYKWSAREITKAGEPIEYIITHGINRVIHSSDCLAVLVKELMLAAEAGKIRLTTVIDNANFLFHYHAGSSKHSDFKRILVDEITVARALKKLIRGNYKGGFTLATCQDPLTSRQNLRPEEILGDDGMDHFNGAEMIHVPKYSRVEFENCMNLYQDVGWMTRPESRTREVRDEIRFVSGLNPGEVFNLCRAL